MWYSLIFQPFKFLGTMATLAEQVELAVVGGATLEDAQKGLIAEAHKILIEDGMNPDEFNAMPVDELIEYADGVMKKKLKAEAKQEGVTDTRMLVASPKFRNAEFTFIKLNGIGRENGFYARLCDAKRNPLMINPEGKLVPVPASAEQQEEEREIRGNITRITFFTNKDGKRLGEAAVCFLFSKEDAGIEREAALFRQEYGIKHLSMQDIVYKTRFQVGGVWINEDAPEGKTRSTGYANLETVDQNGEAYGPGFISAYFPQAIRLAPARK